MEIQKSVYLNDESKIHSPITFNRAMKGGKKTHPSTLINKLTISEVADAISPPSLQNGLSKDLFQELKVAERRFIYSLCSFPHIPALFSQPRLRDLCVSG